MVVYRGMVPPVLPAADTAMVLPTCWGVNGLEAEVRMAEAEAIARARLTKDNNIDTQRDLAYTLASVGNVRREAGDFAGAAGAWEESLALYRSVSALQGGTPDDGERGVVGRVELPLACNHKK